MKLHLSFLLMSTLSFITDSQAGSMRGSVRPLDEDRIGNVKTITAFFENWHKENRQECLSEMKRRVVKKSEPIAPIVQEVKQEQSIHEIPEITKISSIPSIVLSTTQARPVTGLFKDYINTHYKDLSNNPLLSNFIEDFNYVLNAYDEKQIEQRKKSLYENLIFPAEPYLVGVHCDVGGALGIKLSPLVMGLAATLKEADFYRIINLPQEDFLLESYKLGFIRLSSKQLLYIDQFKTFKSHFKNFVVTYFDELKY